MLLAQVMEVIFPGVPYTSLDGTWENIVFDDANLAPGLEPLKVLPETYENALYELQNAEAIQKFREERNALLAQSDKYMTKDYPHRLELDIQNWVDYRKALRDLPMTARPTRDEDGNLVGVEWPTPPKTLVADIYVLEGDLQTTQTDLEEKTYQIISLEARLAALEQKFISN